MPTLVLVDTTSVQTLASKTLTAPIITSPIITSGDVTLAADPTTALAAATKGYVDSINNTILVNGSLHASVASNNLTLHLKTAAGATPTATDSVRVTFRSSTDTLGVLVTRTVTTATTFVLASGSSLGTADSQVARIWVGLVDNAGTVELCAWNPLTTATLSITSYTSNRDVTTVAEGLGTATLAGTLYSTSVRTTVPFLLLGFIEISEATAGVWATAPTMVQTYRDGHRKTGDTVQRILSSTGASATGVTAIPNDDSIPQISEGNDYMSASITPSSTINLLRINSQGIFAQTNAANSIVMAVFQGTTADAKAAVIADNIGNGQTVTLALACTVIAGTLSNTAFTIRAGNTAGTTTTFNGSGGLRKFAGVANSFIEIEEIYV